MSARGGTIIIAGELVGGGGGGGGDVYVFSIIQYYNRLLLRALEAERTELGARIFTVCRW